MISKSHSVVVLIILAVFVLGIFLLKQNTLPAERPTSVPVHIHALVNISICGVHKDLPEHAEGAHFRGTQWLHTHDDNIIHIEGVIKNKEDVSLGAFFDVIEVPFSANKIFSKENGDKCSGKPAKLTMFVNGRENKEFRNYIPFATKKPEEQVINIIFDS